MNPEEPEEHKPVDNKFTLRKLPLWGKQIDENQIDFEWPTQDMLAEGDINGMTRLESLEFKDWGVSITSVRATLSNGKSSPVFQREGCSSDLLKNPKTITFDQKKPIRAVSAYDNSHSWPNVRVISFMDGEGSTVYEYNPRN